MVFSVIVFFKQKTAYEMRISDWSSDVCSSDLSPGEDREHAGREQASGGNARLRPARPEAAPCGIAMLGGEQHRAAPFAADRESLDQPQDDERDRGPDRKSTRLNSSH